MLSKLSALALDSWLVGRLGAFPVRCNVASSGLVYGDLDRWDLRVRGDGVDVM